MMGALLMRDATIGVRTIAFGTALVAHGTLLYAFLLLWSGGVPLLPGGDLYEQQRLVQLVVLACLLPWAATRLGPAEHGDDVVVLAVTTAARPSRIMLARGIALVVLLAIVVLVGFPMMLVAAQIAAVPLRTALMGLFPAFGVAAVAAASALMWSLEGPHRLAVWLGATASTLLVVMTTIAALPGWAGGPGLFLISLGAAFATAARADATRLHLLERQ